MIRLAPCLPRAWPRVTLRLTLGPAPCVVTILNRGGPLTLARLNGQDLVVEGALRIPLAALTGELVLHLGPEKP